MQLLLTLNLVYPSYIKSAFAEMEGSQNSPHPPFKLFQTDFFSMGPLTPYLVSSLYQSYSPNISIGKN